MMASVKLEALAAAIDGGDPRTICAHVIVCQSSRALNRHTVHRMWSVAYERAPVTPRDERNIRAIADAILVLEQPS